MRTRAWERCQCGHHTSALEALSEAGLREQLEEVRPLKGCGAHDQHVRRHCACKELHPTRVTNGTHVVVHRTLGRVEKGGGREDDATDPTLLY